MSRNGLATVLPPRTTTIRPACSTTKIRRAVAGRRGDVERALEVADLDQAHAAPGRRAALGRAGAAGVVVGARRRVGARGGVLGVRVRATGRDERGGDEGERDGWAEHPGRMPRPCNAGRTGIDCCAMSERSCDVVVIGAGPAGEVCAGRLADAGPRGRHRRGAFRRRRVLLLRLHALQGAAAPRPGAGRGAAHPGRRRDDRRPRRAGRLRAPRRGDQPPRRRQPDTVARRPRDRAGARPRADHRRAHRAGGRRDADRAARGGHRHRHRGRCAAHPGPARGAPVDQPRGGDRRGGAGQPRRPRRRHRRRRDGHRVRVVRHQRDGDRGGPARAGARGAVRRRGGVRRAGRRRRRDPRRHPRDGRRADATAASASSSRTARASPATRSSSPWAGASCPPISASTTSAWSPGGPIEVDDTLRVPGHDWLYVIGDANGRALLTHMGKYQGRIAADRILGREVAAAQRRRAQPARDLHRPAGRRRRPHAGQRAGGRHRRPRGRRPHRRQRRRHASSAPAPRAPRASSSTRTAASSSAPPSPGPRSPRRCTRRRSP